MLPKLKKTNCMILLLGTIIQAIGIYNIHSLSNVTEGGVVGLTLLIRHWLGISPAVSSLVLNLGCYIFGWKTLGKLFLLYSGIATAGFSVTYYICEQFPPLWPQLAQHPLLASVLGAVFVGVGCGLCVRFGGAPSGDDALAMSLSKRTKLKIEYIYMISDGIILLLSLSYIPFSRIIFSLLTVLLSGKLIGLIERFHFPKNRKGVPTA